MKVSDTELSVISPNALVLRCKAAAHYVVADAMRASGVLSPAGGFTTFAGTDDVIILIPAAGKSTEDVMTQLVIEVEKAVVNGHITFTD